MSLRAFDSSKIATSRGPESEKLKRVLYVEDDDTSFELAELALRDRFRLDRAKTADDAFNHIRDVRYDVVLMDIMLEGSDLDGIEITQVLKGMEKSSLVPGGKGFARPDVPIIFVTAAGGRYDQLELMKAGGDDLIPKPVDFARLTLAITRLAIRKARVDLEEFSNDLVAGFGNAPRGIERRRGVREEVSLACTLRPLAPGVPAVSSNISPYGAHITVNDPSGLRLFPMGRGLHIELEPVWSGLQVECRVVRIECEDPYTVAVEFVNMTPRGVALIKRWLGQDE